MQLCFFFFTFLYNNWFRLYSSNVFGDSIPDRILIIKVPYTILDSVYYCQRILNNCAISIGRIGLDLVLLLLGAFLSLQVLVLDAICLC